MESGTARRSPISGDIPMNTPQEKLREALEILDSMLARKNTPAVLVRAHRLIESALSDFFQDEDDVAALGQCFPDEPEDWRDEVYTLTAEPPRPEPAA
jgi:hypothetical protein